MNQEKKKDSGSQVTWAEQIVFFIWGIYLPSMDLFLFLFSSVRLLTYSLSLTLEVLQSLFPASRLSLLQWNLYTPIC